MAGSSERRPHPMYQDHNGFVERVMLKMAGAIPSAKCNLHAVAAHPENASPEDLRELRDAVQRRRFVEDVMELDGIYFPGLDAIKMANETQDTSATLKERMKEEQKKHIEDTRKLYKWQAGDYCEEMINLSRSKADIDDPHVEDFYQASRSSFDIANTFDDNLDRFNHARMSSLIAIATQRKACQQREEAEQQRRDRQFPSSIDDFHAIRNKDVQIRIARFLVADDSKRDQMMTSFNWAWRQVAPLVNDYQQSQPFKTEIERLLRDLEVQDPRKARMGT
ncbi:hypothetical protein PYCCODRAFT_1457322 [Trametes coccinea BRFM310]|uniref:Uncharacterized protein n=1 Tax=Trametes coccinea (strain BRFM310) TaxID=1353009 RepID=A0A1Y2IZ85_TRAC3|nr:hypothetical protein PYCCODRAFT_1457322 [Trametes coccinea BRFM310]